MEIKGKHNTINIFTDNIDSNCYGQLQLLANDEQYKDFIIKIMPDCHAGKGCTIGTTMIGKKDIAVNPSLVGVDIGCGVTAFQINPLYKDKFTKEFLLEMDDFLHKGIGTRKASIKYKSTVKITSSAINNLKNLKIWDTFDNDTKKYICEQLGTLGSGNHFIEIDASDDFALIIHSGSRYLGQLVAKYYCDLFEADPNNTTLWYQDYLHDMQITQQYAFDNRKTIGNEIINFLGVTYYDIVQSIHNYVEIKNNLQYIRKGAISAYQNEKFIIPFNMQYGTIIGISKGNWEWNYSLPHGAGRVMSRSQAFKNADLNAFINSMKNVISTSVNAKTLDESPQAYKDPNEILSLIKDQIAIIKKYIPFYVFKGC